MMPDTLEITAHPTRTLTPIDEHLALVLDSALLDALGIDATTALTVRVEGDALVIRRAQDRAARIQKIAARVADDHASAFERLAR